jgi:hypothetical protein
MDMMERKARAKVEDLDLCIHTASPRPFFDVPIYRLTEDEYIAEFEKTRQKRLGPEGIAALGKQEQENPACEGRRRERLLDSYGGPWQFNEIVGFIRLVFMGGQVRGHLWMVRERRIKRTRTRTLFFRSLKAAPEMELPRDASNLQIYEAISEYLGRVQRKFPTRFIDTLMFDRIGSFVDWRALREKKWS